MLFWFFYSFLEEPPFIILSEPDPVSSKCSMNRGVPCKVPVAATDGASAGNDTFATKCCSGTIFRYLAKET